MAMDVSCSWSGTTESIWRELNPDLWERTHNSWAVLQTVSGERLRSVISGPEFRRTLEELGRARSGSKPPRFFGSDSCRQR